MTVELFLTDAYLRNFEARVLRLDGREIILDRTAFYPGGGGQPADKGRLKVGPVGAAVVDVRREGANIVHVLDRRIPRTVECIGGELDWERRYAHMRCRTALHVLSGIVHKNFGAEVAGARIRAGVAGAARARLDFSFPGDWSPETAGKIECLVNEALSGGRSVRFYELGPQEVPDGGWREYVLTRTEPAVENVREVLVVEIEGSAARTDGGTHVANTREVGELEITGHESRGGQRKRLEFTLR